ncbi:MAG: tetratricopeptide repeat protein [Myxococcales bacterium]
MLEPTRDCASSPKGAFKLERPKAAPTPAVVIAPPPAGKFKSKEAEDFFTEARSARGAFDLRSALKALKLADAKEPDHPDVLLEMSDVYRQLKETEKAIEILNRLAKKEKRYGNYNLACLEAQTGRRESAILHLNLAAAAGWSFYDETLGDPDLESLRGTPEFEAVLAKVQKNAERERRSPKR